MAAFVVTGTPSVRLAPAAPASLQVQPRKAPSSDAASIGASQGAAAAAALGFAAVARQQRRRCRSGLRDSAVVAAAAAGSPGELVLVDSVPACQAAVDALMQEGEVAVDLEGVNLGRRPGRVSLVQACGRSCPTIYLFDITTLDWRAFLKGGLKKFFEAPEVLKVFLDARADADCLLHNHSVRLAGAYDLQVLYHLRFCGQGRKFLKGYKDIILSYGRTELPAEEMHRLLELKEEGKRLFVPKFGGNPSAWETRPLQEALIRYCAADVQHLLGMKELWGKAELQDLVLETTAKRIADFAGQARKLPTSKRKYRDFAIPEGLGLELPDGCVERRVAIREDKVGLVIGKLSAQMKAIEETSGASMNVDGTVARVVGTPAEVEAAVQRIRDAISSKPPRR